MERFKSELKILVDFYLGNIIITELFRIKVSNVYTCPMCHFQVTAIAPSKEAKSRTNGNFFLNHSPLINLLKLMFNMRHVIYNIQNITDTLHRNFSIV